MKTPQIVALAIGIPFSMAVAGVAAHHIDVERVEKGAVHSWSRSSCNNAFFCTECKDGQTELRYIHMKSGTVADISAQTDTSKMEEMIEKWGASKGQQEFEVRYKKSLADMIVSPNGAYYAISIKPAP